MFFSKNSSAGHLVAKREENILKQSNITNRNPLVYMKSPEIVYNFLAAGKLDKSNAFGVW